MSSSPARMEIYAEATRIFIGFRVFIDWIPRVETEEEQGRGSPAMIEVDSNYRSSTEYSRANTRLYTP